MLTTEANKHAMNGAGTTLEETELPVVVGSTPEEVELLVGAAKLYTMFVELSIVYTLGGSEKLLFSKYNMESSDTEIYGSFLTFVIL